MAIEVTVGSGADTEADAVRAENAANAAIAAQAAAEEAAAGVEDVQTEVDGALAAIAAAEASALSNIQAATAATSFASFTDAIAGSADGEVIAVLQAGGYAVDIFDNQTDDLAYIGTSASGDGVALATAKALMGSSQTSAQLTTSPIIDLVPLDAAFTDGRIVPNRRGDKPGRNMVNRQAFLRDSTVTPNYTGVYHRVQFASVSDELLFGPTINGKSYRFKVAVKSTAGAGAQSITIGRYTGSMTSQAITEGADAVFDMTKVGSSGGQFAIRGDGAYPLDFLVKIIPQIYEDNEVPEDVTTENGNVMSWQSRQINDPGLMVFDEGGITGGHVGRIPLTEDDGNYTLAAGTVMMAVRKDGTPGGDGAFGGALYTPNLGNTTYDSITLGCEGTNTLIHGPGVTGSASQIGNIAGEGYHILGVRFDATTSDAFFEGISINQGTGTGGTALQFPYFGVGGGYQDTRPWNGQLGPIMVWDRKLTTAEYANALEVMRDRISLSGGVNEPRRFFLVTAGDSITNGFNPAGGTFSSYAKLAAEAQDPILKYKNYAVNSQNLDQYLADSGSVKTKTEARITEAAADGFTPILVMMYGTNNTSGTSIAELEEAWQDAKDAGAVVIACTIPSQSSTAAYQALNAAIRASTVPDYICDWSANIIATNAYLNGTYFHADGVHPIQAGHNDMRDTLIAKLAVVYADN